MSVSIDGVRFHVPESVPSAAEPDPRPESVPKSDSGSPSSFERLLHGLGKDIERGERIVAGAMRGYASLDAAELIAVQAGIYRYGEAIELASKLVDRATGAVRTVLSGGH